MPFKIVGVDENNKFPSRVETRLKNERLSVHPVYRVWNGTSYPARVSGATNIFFGPNDPGLLMSTGDYWANSNYTTLATVIAEVLASGSALRNAVNSAAMPERVFVPAGTLEDIAISGPDHPTRGNVPSGPSVNSVPVWNMADAISTRLGALVPIPKGWGSAEFSIYWTRNNTAAAANVRLQLTATPIVDGSTLTTNNPAILNANVTTAVPDQQKVKVTKMQASGQMALPISGESVIRIGFARNAGHADDTFTDTIALLGIELVRAS